MSSDLRPSQASADLAAQNGDVPMSDSDRILEKSIRTLLFLLLVLIVTSILVASIVFSDDSRVFPRSLPRLLFLDHPGMDLSSSSSGTRDRASTTNTC